MQAQYCMLGCQYTSIEVCMYTFGIGMYAYFYMHTFNYASVQSGKYASMLVCACIALQYASILCRHVFKYAIIYLHLSMQVCISVCQVRNCACNICKKSPYFSRRLVLKCATRITYKDFTVCMFSSMLVLKYASISVYTCLIQLVITHMSNSMQMFKCVRIIFDRCEYMYFNMLVCICVVFICMFCSILLQE